METPSPLAKPLPLLHDSDAYFIYCLEEGDKHVRISSIERFPGNVQVSPTKERFSDLDPGTRKAVIAQVNRRYQGRVVRV